MQSPFEGRLVRLRAREETDLERFFRWLNDPEVTQYIELRYPVSVEQERQILAGAPPADYEGARFSIDTLDGVHIGSCALRNSSAEDRSADLGITIGDKGYWNGGYGTDAMRVLCRFGFEHMNLHRIELHVFSDNPRAQRVYENVGFKVEGCLRDADYRYGHYRDVVVMGLLRDDFQDQLSAPSAASQPSGESK
ncbi:MAG TPA: GNAT family protein [Tepidiformaceae bacterium]|nr:GNAT family protein [Tepidiformaceae bacterium]